MQKKSTDNPSDDRDFIDALLIQFPELKEEVLDEDYLGITSLQIGCFRRFTQAAIDNNDLRLVKKCFDFVEENLDSVLPKIKNSLMVSYLGKLNMEKNIAAYKSLPRRLSEANNDLESYYTTINKDQKIRDFLDRLY